MKRRPDARKAKNVKKLSRNDDIKLRFDSYFREGVLYHGWNGGFFSCLSLCLWNLVFLYAKYKIVPARIDFSRAFKLFKTAEQLNGRVDVYPLLFKPMPVPAELRTDVLLKHHTFYNKVDIKRMSAWILRFFTPADSIRALQEKLCCKYNIDMNNTLAVWARGTDKASEVKNSSVDNYCKKCEEILRKKPGLRIWIQTDQKQYQDYFLEKFPLNSFAIDELPTTEKSIGMHNDKAFEIDKFQYGEYLLAVAHLMAQCNTVVTHTGNIGYWKALYRGNLENFYQDTAHFYDNKGPRSLMKFNSIPLRYRAKDALLRFPGFKKIQNPRLREIFKKAIDSIFFSAS